MSRAHITFYEVASDITAVTAAVSFCIGGSALIGAEAQLITERFSESLLRNTGAGGLIIAGISTATGLYIRTKEQ